MFVVGDWLLVVGYWLLVICCWLTVLAKEDTAVPFPYARLIVGTRHCRVLTLGNIAILNDLLIVREQDARTVRVLPSIDFATDLGLLYQFRGYWI